MFQPWSDIDWLDQAAHLLAGSAIVLVAGFLLPWWAGVGVSMGLAIGREQWQHWGQCQAGCRTDLAFWGLGSILGAGIGKWLYG